MTTLTGTALKRVLRDISELTKNPLHSSGIYILHDEQNISHATAVLFGDEETPYQFGAYFFDFHFPNNYPFEPPKGKFMTRDPQCKTRFHPNLYVDGKICMSILNTWSGPPWTSVQTFSSVLLSIKSIMNEKPLTNEPSYENASDDYNAKYNLCVKYENYRVAVLHQLQHIPEGFEHFRQIVEENFMKNYEKMKAKCQEYNNTETGVTGYSQVYGMQVTPRYDNILKGLKTTYNHLAEKYGKEPDLSEETLVVGAPSSPKRDESLVTTSVVVVDNKHSKKIMLVKKK